MTNHTGLLSFTLRISCFEKEHDKTDEQTQQLKENISENVSPKPKSKKLLDQCVVPDNHIGQRQQKREKT
jgi:hypothetical protein